MKDEAFILGQSKLLEYSKRPFCRNIVKQILNDPSYLFDDFPANVTKEEIREILTNTHKESFSFEITFLRYLHDNHLIEFGDIVKGEDEASGLTWVDIRINKKFITDVVSTFYSSTILEPYGLEKQARIIEKVFQVKFSRLENQQIALTNNDFVTSDLEHLEMVKALLYLEQTGNLQLTECVVDCDIKNYRDQYDRKGYSVPYGIPHFRFRCNLQTKLLAKWAAIAGLKIEPVSFDVNTGALTLDGTNYFIFKPGNIDFKLFTCLVENINTYVPQDKLAMITWGVSDQSGMETLYRQNGGKNKVHQKNKIRINDIRKKLMKYGLHNKLTIESGDGYKLVYTKSDINTQELAQYFSDKELGIEDIPF